MNQKNKITKLREKLVKIALEWQREFGIAPSITSAISECDAMALVGCYSEENASEKTAVQKGYDFKHKGIRYQVKANRPSGKPGSKVTLIPKAKNYEWDKIIWILYDEKYIIQYAYIWDCNQYKRKFKNKETIRPKDIAMGKRIYPKNV